MFRVVTVIAPAAAVIAPATVRMMMTTNQPNETIDDSNNKHNLTSPYENAEAEVASILPNIPKQDQRQPVMYGVWEFLAFHLLTGESPFTKPSDTKQPILNWHGIQDVEVQEFIQSLLSYHPHDRPTAQQINRSKFWAETNFADHEMDVQRVLDRLTNCHKEHQFKVAVRSYIATNFLHEREKERLEQVFRWLDYKNNNTISRAEFQRAMLESEMNISLEAMDQFFHQVDVNGDKKISYAEFMAFAEREERLFDKKNLQAAFDALDWSNSGYITEDDLIHFAGSATGASAFRGETMMKKSTICAMIERAFKNGDGKISFDEFAEMMLPKSSSKSHVTGVGDEQRRKKKTRKSKKEKKARKEYYAKLLNRKAKR